MFKDESGRMQASASSRPQAEDVSKSKEVPQPLVAAARPHVQGGVAFPQPGLPGQRGPEAPPERAARVQALKQQVADGRYQVDPHAVAAAMQASLRRRRQP